MTQEPPQVAFLIRKDDALAYFGPVRMERLLGLKRNSLDNLPVVNIKGRAWLSEYVSLKLHYLSGYKVPMRGYRFKDGTIMPIKSESVNDGGKIEMEEKYMLSYPPTVRDAMKKSESPTINILIESLGNLEGFDKLTHKKKLDFIGVDMICEVIIHRGLAVFCDKIGVPISAVSKWVRADPERRDAFDNTIFMSGLMLSDESINVATGWLPKEDHEIKNKKIMTDTLSREAASRMKQKEVAVNIVAAPVFNETIVRQEGTVPITAPNVNPKRT